MGIKAFDHIKVTGLVSNSGGAWSGANLNVDLSAIVTTAGSSIPNDATGVVILSRYKSGYASSSQTIGLRSSGKTIPHRAIAVPFSGLFSQAIDIVPFTTGKKLDLYTTDATNVEFYILGVTDSTWVFYDIDATLPTFAGTSSAWANRVFSGAPYNVPANAALLLATCDKWVPTGQTANAMAQANNPEQQIVKLDAASTATFNLGGATYSVVGYAKDGFNFNWETWKATTSTYTASSWAQSSYAATGKAMVLLQPDMTFTGFTRVEGRKTGSTYNPVVANYSRRQTLLSPVNTSGNFDVAVMPTSAGSLYVLATVNSYVSASIVSIDKLDAGTTSTVTFSGSFTPSSLSISDGVRSIAVTAFSGSGAVWTFTCPDLVDSTLGIMLGTVTVTATDGVTTTAAFGGAYTKNAYTPVVVTLVSPDAIGQGFSPALQIGDELAIESAKGSVSNLGIFTSDFFGVQTAWHLSVSDNRWRSFIIETVDSSQQSNNGSAGIRIGIGLGI